ncbi:MAG: TAXI family TRAP transporter solute-binding subunit [Pseudomonadales bacterium]
MKHRYFTVRFLVCVTLLGWLSQAVAEDDIKLPRAMAWSAYNLGTTGYNQAVGISKMLKNRHRVALRVIPAKNDVSRMLPLMVNRVQFAANGVATYFAQEGVFQFASERWGPVPIRVVMMSVGLSNQGVAVTARSGMTRVAELKGKRIPWVRGAPALNISTEAQLACGGLTWDDVERVDYPGYGAMWNGMVEGQIDAAFATTVSGTTRKLEASPAGIHWLKLPHDNQQCWQNMLAIAPYYTPHVATRGTGISDATPHEGATYPYPILVTLAAQEQPLVYSLTRALHEGFDDYKNSDPGSLGWGMERQNFQWVVPFHDGAVRYFKEIGVWQEQHEAHNQRLLERQQVLAAAWQAMGTLGITDKDEFRNTWMKLRALRLEKAGFNPVWQD